MLNVFGLFKRAATPDSAFPDFPFGGLADLLRRGRALLDTRTDAQFGEAVLTVIWLIDDYFDREKEKFIQRLLERGGSELAHLPEHERNEAGIRWLVDNWPIDAGSPAYQTRDDTSDLMALQEAIADVELDALDFPDAQPHEYFATLAFLQMAHAVRLVDDSRAGVTMRLAQTGTQMLAALDTLCWAEQVRAMESLRKTLVRESHAKSVEIVRKHVSLQASKAAIARHAENRAMKTQVLEWYALHHGEFASLDKAAEAVAGHAE